jgi:succinyl-diaminopimelate desuccinylase
VSTHSSRTRRLAQRTLELVNIRSESRHEAEIMAAVRAAIPAAFVEWYWDGDALVVGTPRRAGVPLVVLAGHVDTVPAQDNYPGHMTETEVVGLGASDMKAGIAVMLEIADWIAATDPRRVLDVALVIFSREELPVIESPLPAAFSACPELLRAQLAVVLEPTDNTIQAGCVGNLNATLRFRGVAAHSARPWTGENAIARAVHGLTGVIDVPPRTVEIQGLPFTEVISVTRIAGGVADNVIPDLVECHVNFRFAPDRSPEEAITKVRRIVGDDAELEILSVSASGRVAPPSDLLARLAAAGGFAVAPKQAWTPVAQFTEVGVDAVNLGPGATAMAHTRAERVVIEEMERTCSALAEWIAPGAGA